MAGGLVGGAIPVPIPNTEVKTSRADGTAPSQVWESRSLPATINKTPVYAYTGVFVLEVPPVKLAADLQRMAVDAVEAAHVHHRPGAPVVSLAAPERADTADGAEAVVDALLAELIVGHAFLSLHLGQLRGRDKGYDRPGSSVHRAVTGKQVLQLQFGVELNCSAVAASTMGYRSILQRFDKPSEDVAQ